jgi:hypothetical protein
MKESLEVTRAYMALGEALSNMLEAPNRIFLSEMRAYMALGGALRNMWEAHDRALYERDEALAALAQLQETDRARRAIDDMNRDQHLADLRKGIPLRVEPSEQEDFHHGDLVRVKNEHPEWVVISNHVDEGLLDVRTCLGGGVEALQRVYPKDLERKPVEKGDTVRLRRIDSFSGRVKSIQHNEIGIARAWFDSDFSVRLDECIAIDPTVKS